MVEVTRAASARCSHASSNTAGESPIPNQLNPPASAAAAAVRVRSSERGMKRHPNRSSMPQPRCSVSPCIDLGEYLADDPRRLVRRKRIAALCLGHCVDDGHGLIVARSGGHGLTTVRVLLLFPLGRSFDLASLARPEHPLLGLGSTAAVLVVVSAGYHGHGQGAVVMSSNGHGQSMPESGRVQTSCCLLDLSCLPLHVPFRPTTGDHSRATGVVNARQRCMLRTPPLTSCRRSRTLGPPLCPTCPSLGHVGPHRLLVLALLGRDALGDCLVARLPRPLRAVRSCFEN